MLRLIFCLLAVLSPCCLADPVSRELPATYDAEIRPLLTEAVPLLAEVPAREAAERGGEVVLREQIVVVDERGAKVEATHSIYRAVAESGVRGLSRDVEAFNKKRTRLHLALARTIQPDGKSLPVREEAAFLQTPQRSADWDIYNDQSEMVLIYPDVKQGSATESIVVAETEGRIPGEFTMQHVFAGGWPVRRDRLVLDVPKNLAARLRITSLGSGLPEPKREELEGGERVRWTWERRDIPGVRQEENRVAMDQTGPAVFLTTLPDWESFIRWYLPLAERSMTLSRGLKEQIDGWTREARTPQEITAILLRKVASEVRYAGLEFGSGDLVPREADVVWDNQYGDCKDKACLLAAMLRHKGLTAWPALINTSFPGRVERRSPDYRHFDHCITAVAGPEGKWIFCDPTIPGLPPGEVGPSDGDREVLLVKPGADWARTPAHDFGIMRHRFEATMDAAGEVSGWATIQAEGYNAARLAEMERKSTPESLRDSLQTMLSRLAEGLTAADVKRHEPKENQPWEVEAYILIPGGGAASVPLLADAGYVPQTGNETQRETAFPAWREVYEAEARIQLPPGLSPASLPEPLHSSSAWSEASGNWEWKDGAVISKFRFTAKADQISPADFPAFAAQMRAVNAWMSRPLPLTKGAGNSSGSPDGKSPPAPAMAAAADPADSLPHLPTVAGQLRLVEGKYPESANAPLRRAALEKSIRFFPGNQEMLHRAGSLLAWMDLQDDHPEAALRRLDSFQESCRGHVDAEEAAMGDYCRALALSKVGRGEEARTLFTKLSADVSVSPFRRTWAFYHLSRLAEEEAKDPAKALALLREGMTLQAGQSEAVLYPVWARLRLAESGGAEEVRTLLVKLVADRAEAAPGILTQMARMADSIPEALRAEYLKQLRECGPPASFGQDFVSALESADKAAGMESAGRAIRSRLSGFLKEHPDPSDGIVLPGDLKTPARMTEALTGMIEKGIPDADQQKAVKLGLDALLKSGPDGDLPVMVLNLIRAVNARDLKAPEGGLLDEVLALGEMLPKSADNHYEAIYTRLLLLQSRGQRGEMRRVAEAVIPEADKDRVWIAVAPLQLLLRQSAEEGDHAEVLRICQVIRGYEGFQASAETYFYEAVVYIMDGRHDEAFTALEALSKRPAKALENLSMSQQAISLVTWALKDKAVTVKWWKDSAGWWPAMLEAAGKVNPDGKLPPHPPLPVIMNGDPQIGPALAAAQRKEFALMADYLTRVAAAGRLDPARLVLYGVVLSNHAVPDGLLGFADKELNKAMTAAAGAVPAESGLETLSALMVEAAFRQSDWPVTAALAAGYFRQIKEMDSYSGYVLRYWAVAADNLKTGREPLLEIFRKVLDSGADEKERPRNIWLYAILLNQDGRSGEASAMLQKELDGGKLDETHPMTPQVRQLLRQNQSNSSWSQENPAALAAAASQWVKAARPAWLDYVEPAGTAGPALVKKAADSIRRKEALWDINALKAAVLVLGDPSQPADLREEAGVSFVTTAPMMSADPARRNVEWNTVFTSPGLPELMRARSLAFSLLSAAAQGWTRTFERWSNHPLLAKAEPEYQNMVRRWRDILADNSLNGVKLKAAAMATLEDDPAKGRLLGFSPLFKCLANQDPVAAAEVLKQFQEKQYPESIRETVDQLRVELPRFLEDVTQFEALHAALTKAMLTALKTEAVPLSPEDLLAGEHQAEVANASAPVRLSLMLRRIETRNFDHSSLAVWSSLGSCLEPGRSRPVREAMARAVIQAADSDETAAAAVRLVRSCLDLDDPGEVEIMRELMKPLAAKTEWTVTADWLTFGEAAQSLRTGEAADVSGTLALIHDSTLRSRLAQRQISTLLAENRQTELKKLLRGMPPSVLLHPECLSAAIPAWRALGQKDQADAGQERQRAQMRRYLGMVWAWRDTPAVIGCLESMIIFEDPSLLPAGLEEDLSRWVAEPADLATARFLIAYLRQDWETCARHGQEAIRRHPTMYPWYFYAGKACAGLGRKEEAAALLKTYLEKTHDEPSVREARGILKSLQP